jgi:O-antigen/teichoic acid export membrane protein
MSSGLRIVFWIHAIVALVFGLAMLFVPMFVIDLFGFEPGDLYNMRILGVALVAMGFSSVLAAQAQRFERVAIVLLMEVVFTVISLLVALYAVIFAGAPVMVWLDVAIFAIFAVLFGYYYWQTRTIEQPQPGTPALR